MCCGQLLGNLKTGVAASHDQHCPMGQLIGVPVLGAVQLGNGRIEPFRNRRSRRDLEWSRCHDQLAGFEGSGFAANFEHPISKRGVAHQGVGDERQLK